MKNLIFISPHLAKYSATMMAVSVKSVLSMSNALSREFGHFQAEEPRLDGPAFIPAHGKSRIYVTVAYPYPSEWTPQEKNDEDKVIKS